jgi:hypothetical protein
MKVYLGACDLLDQLAVPPLLTCTHYGYPLSDHIDRSIVPEKEARKVT